MKFRFGPSKADTTGFTLFLELLRRPVHPQRVTSVNEREKATSEGRMAEARVAKDRIKQIVGRADTGAAKAVRQVRNTVRFSRAQFQLAVAPKRKYGHYAVGRCCCPGIPDVHS